MKADDFISSLDDPSFSDHDVPTNGEEKPPQIEIAIDAKTGRPRQAGAAESEGRYIQQFREKAERSIFAFAKGVLGLTRLTPTLHREVSHWLQSTPPYRKLCLLPRDHLKTSLFSRAGPIHVLVQPKDHNIYRPGIDGASTRILLSNETATNAEHFLRWIEGRFESCNLLRALWPHRCWEAPRRQSRKWNEKEMVIPREDDYPEASIETIGVGGAITSRHYDLLIKDDLVTIEAANSPIVMADAIDWHKASRALMDDPDRSMEWICGTRWAALDLYQYIINNDPSVEIYHRSAIEDGIPIFPELFSLDTLNRIRKEVGSALFALLYMNNAADPELVDFDVNDIRRFEIVGDTVQFDEDDRDTALQKRRERPPPAPADLRGIPFNSSTYDLVMGREEWVRLKYG